MKPRRWVSIRRGLHLFQLPRRGFLRADGAGSTMIAGGITKGYVFLVAMLVAALLLGYLFWRDMWYPPDEPKS